jgi:hypothetical protein
MDNVMEATTFAEIELRGFGEESRKEQVVWGGLKAWERASVRSF